MKLTKIQADWLMDAIDVKMHDYCILSEPDAKIADEVADIINQCTELEESSK